jgi:glycosyltransferase involved in cell wall biosynthesis
LIARGHEVTPFALRYARNEPTPDAQYFPPPPVDEDFVLYGDRRLGRREQARLAARVIRNPTVFRAAQRVLRERRIELVYALQIANHLYPELIFAAREAGVPVVMRLSDFQMVCPAYHCLRDGRPCFLCRESLAPALVHRCLKKSLAVTGARVAAMAYARTKGAPRSVARYLSPSCFLIETMASAGFASAAMTHLPTPVALPPDPGPPPDDGPLLYVGNLSETKGVRVALDAVRDTGRRLLLAGDPHTPDARALRDYAAGVREAEFVGFATGAKIESLYAQAKAVLVPSLWWENVPHTALEAMARRRPVLASGHGSLPEIVRHGETGLLFTPGDAVALREAIRNLDEPGLADRLGQAGRAFIAREHDPDEHLRRLEDIFREVLA